MIHHGANLEHRYLGNFLITRVSKPTTNLHASQICDARNTHESILRCVIWLDQDPERVWAVCRARQSSTSVIRRARCTESTGFSSRSHHELFVPSAKSDEPREMSHCASLNDACIPLMQSEVTSTTSNLISDSQDGCHTSLPQRYTCFCSLQLFVLPFHHQMIQKDSSSDSVPSAEALL